VLTKWDGAKRIVLLILFFSKHVLESVVVLVDRHANIGCRGRVRLVDKSYHSNKFEADSSSGGLSRNISIHWSIPAEKTKRNSRINKINIRDKRGASC